MTTLNGTRVAFLTNAGACWVDEQCHVDQGWSPAGTGRPAGVATLIEELAEGAHAGQWVEMR